jgi:hypothetical protein
MYEFSSSVAVMSFAMVLMGCFGDLAPCAVKRVRADSILARGRLLLVKTVNVDTR